MTCIFHFRYTPSNEMFFTNSKPNKSFDWNAETFFDIINPFPKPLLDNRLIAKSSNSLNSNSRNIVYNSC